MVLRTSRKCQNCGSEHFKLLSNRKAQVETQFNWIFVLIVGAIIMIFFVAIVMRQKASSEFKISETVMTDLQSIFTGGSVSTGTSQLIETPKIEIDFYCTSYSMGINKPSNPIENMVIFAPTKIQGRNIITWTLDYNLPYKITNFLYITTPEMRYIFVTNSPRLISFYNSTLPKEMNVEFIDDVSQIKNKNNYKVRLIFFSDPQSEAVPEELRYLGEDLTALWIQASVLTFYKAKGDRFVTQGDSDGKTYTADIADQQLEPSKYGAIFTDDIEMYNCMMSKALKRAYFVSRVYEERNKNIIIYLESTNSYCSYFQYSQQDFAIFVTGLERAHSQFPEDLSIQALPASASQIADKNKILLQKSCPLIY